MTMWQRLPHCVTERLNKDGEPELAIDFDKLRAELSNEVLEGGEDTDVNETTI